MNTDRIRLMREENVSKALFKLGMPMVISMLVTALYNVVDTYFVSGLGKEAVAAVSVAFSISLIFSGIGLTFGAGAGSCISRLLGKQEQDMANRTASTAMFSSVIVSVLTGAVMLLFLPSVLKFLGAIPSIFPLAREYAVLFIISTILSAANVTAGNLAVAQGSSNISLTAMISGSILNVILDPICITSLGMGVRGAALATLISQFVTVLIYVYFFTGKKSYIKISFSYFRPSLKIYSEILKIGVSMLLLQLLSSFSMSRILVAAGAYGEDAIAAMGITLRIVTLGTNVVFGYMKGFQPMAGFNYGAGNFPRLWQSIRSCIKWTTLFCIVWTIFIFFLSQPILSFFSNDPAVLKIAVPALRANTVMFFTFGFQFTVSTLYLAVGRALEGGFLNICRQGILFMPLILILPGLLGLNGVLYAQAAADTLTTLVTILFTIPIRRSLRG